MTAPRRILDEPDVSERVRHVLRGVRASAPAYDVARGVERFEALLAKSPSPLPLRSVHEAVGASSGTRTLVVKVTLLVGALLLVGGGTYAYVARIYEPPTPLPRDELPALGREGEGAAPPERAVSRIPPSASASPAPMADGPSASPSPEVRAVSVSSLPAVRPSTSPIAAGASRSAVPSAPIVTPRSTVDDREREVLHLAKLQRTAASDPTRAIDLALAGHAEFPQGALFQEREVILVDALVQVGRLREAKEHARAFVEAYPKTPAILHLRAITETAAP